MGWSVRRLNPAGGWDFLHPSRLALGPTQPPIQGYRDFPRVEQLGDGVDHPPPSSIKVEEKLKLHIFYPSGPLWPNLGLTLSLPLLCCKWPHLLRSGWDMLHNNAITLPTKWVICSKDGTGTVWNMCHTDQIWAHMTTTAFRQSKNHFMASTSWQEPISWVQSVHHNWCINNRCCRWC
jgi:hypothetical protein